MKRFQSYEVIGEVEQRKDSKLTTTLENICLQSAGTLCLHTFSENLDFQRKIASLLGVYSLDVCERKVEETHKHYPFFRDRLCSCVRYHAEQSRGKTDSLDVIIVTLQNGRSPENQGNLGGDPLRDSVLAEAMTLNDSHAVTVFEKDYFVYLKSIAFRVHAVFGNDPDEWWNEFLDFLAGYSHTKVKLKKYQGKCALKFWLRVVLWNFLRRRPLPEGSLEYPEELPMSENRNKIELHEIVTVFATLVRGSLLTLPERDRLLLSMIYIDQLLKKDIAVIFNVHPGQIGRWEENAINHFRNEMTRRLEQFPKSDLHEEILNGVADNPQEFSDSLIDALKHLRAEASDE